MNREQQIARLTAGGLTREQATELAAAGVNVVSASADPVWHPRSLLSRATELVQIGWCQYVAARDVTGRACEPWDPHAKAWSLDGAIEQAAREAEQDDGVSKDAVEGGLLALIHTIEDRGGQELAYWNDDPDRTRAGVVELCQTVLAELAGR